MQGINHEIYLSGNMRVFEHWLFCYQVERKNPVSTLQLCQQDKGIQFLMLRLFYFCIGLIIVLSLILVESGNNFILLSVTRLIFPQLGINLYLICSSRTFKPQWEEIMTFFLKKLILNINFFTKTSNWRLIFSIF